MASLMRLRQDLSHLQSLNSGFVLVRNSNNAWIDSSDVLPMFPTVVWKLQLKSAIYQPMNERLLAMIETLQPNAALLVSGKGWQSENNLLKRDALKELLSCIDKGARSVLRFLRIGCDALEVTGCWANILPKGGYTQASQSPQQLPGPAT